MTREEREKAIAYGKEQLDVFGGKHAEFIKLAIEALEKEPTVQAIPLGKVEQIKEEIGHAMDMEPAWKGQDNYVGGLEIALSIIDKKLKEQRNDSR